MTVEGSCDVLRASFCLFGVRPASKKAQHLVDVRPDKYQLSPFYKGYGTHSSMASVGSSRQVERSYDYEHTFSHCLVRRRSHQ